MTKKTALLFTLTLTGVVDPSGNQFEGDTSEEAMTTDTLSRNLDYCGQVIMGNGLITADTIATLESHDLTVTVTRGYPWAPDIGLTAAELDAKYNPHGDGEHPDFPREDWREMVRMQDTALGYWAWLADHLHTYDPDNDA